MAFEQRDYTALTELRVNNVVAAYPGDAVTRYQAENHPEWEIGVHLRPEKGDLTARPTRSATRDEWATYAKHQGVPPEQVDEMTRQQIMDAFPDTAQDGTRPVPLRPAETAPKAEWVEHALMREKGLDRDEVERRTKADLIARYGDGGDLDQQTRDADVAVGAIHDPRERPDPDAPGQPKQK